MKEIEGVLKTLTSFHQAHPWSAAASTLGVTLIAVIVLNFAVRLMLDRLARRFEDRRPYLQITADAVDRPLNLLTWVLVARLVIPITLAQSGADVSAYAPMLTKAMAVLVVLFVAWGAWRIAAGTRLYLRKKYARTDGGYDDFSMIETGQLVARTSIVLVAGFSLLGALGIPLSALTALGVVGGFGAYALTMANQILISNLFAGFAIYFDRPFAVGDWISTKGGTIEGTVTKIGFRLTTIVGFDKRPIYVPNSVFNESATINPSRMSNRRILQSVGVRYEDLHRVEPILATIRDYLKNNDAVDHKMITLVNLVNGSTNMGSSIEGCFGASSSSPFDDQARPPHPPLALILAALPFLARRAVCQMAEDLAGSLERILSGGISARGEAGGTRAIVGEV